MENVRDTIRDRLHAMVGAGSGFDLGRPEGDPGLFGPGSAAWAVHADFTAMMIGGTSALLLQMLHPGALAGVWDHSNWREDTAGRLKRTAQFIAVTTYGATAAAEALIARVRRIHDRVAGHLPEGTAYSANDPALLTWVHVAETRSFLAAHLLYRDSAMTPARQELYHREMAGLARRLGAPDVPTSRRAVERYLQATRPALRFDGRTREVARALLDQPPAAEVLGMAQDVIIQAAIDLLPGWAQRLHGLEVAPIRRPAIRLGAHGAAQFLRWALAPRVATAG